MCFLCFLHSSEPHVLFGAYTRFGSAHGEEGERVECWGESMHKCDQILLRFDTYFLLIVI